MFTTCTLYGGEYELPAGPDTENILVHELEMHMSDVREIAAREVGGDPLCATEKQSALAMTMPHASCHGSLTLEAHDRRI